MFGILALTGVVVNDSLVLLDFTNRSIKDGMPIDRLKMRFTKPVSQDGER